METAARKCELCAVLAALLSCVTAGVASDNILSMAPVGNPSANMSSAPYVSSPVHRDQVQVREKRIYFPPDPPPLGAQINSGGHAGTSALLRPTLGPHVGELFYPPLSTCVTEFGDTAYRRLRPRVDTFTKSRDALLVELRTALAGLAGASAEARLAILSALARQQNDALTKLEVDADALRRDMSDPASWYDRREWKLRRGPLRERQPEHAVLEFQVVRAAAFYQPGLAPAQRRLLREAAMLMQDELFTDDAGTMSGGAAPSLIFFSPDLARLLPAENYPSTVQAMLAKFVEEKDALRRAVKETVLEIDRAVLTSARTRACETLAREQGPRLVALDESAEAIRREYAPTFARHRLASPLQLPPDLARKIDEYEQGKRRFLAGFEEEQRALQEQLNRPAPGESVSRTFVPGRGWVYPELDALKQTYPQEHATELAQLTRMLGEIYPLLVAAAGPSRVDPPLAGSDSFLVTFMEELRRERAYYEYEIAVWEPGLSPAQRRLMFNGAMAQLELPLPRPERQPTKLPLTLLESGELK